MEITIGVQNVARELELEVSQTAEEVAEAVTAAVSAGTPLVLTDVRGRSVVVPIAALGYVEIGSPAPGRVGFGAH